MSFAPPRPSSQKLQEPLLSVTQVSVISTAPATSFWLCCWHRGRIWDVPWWWHCPRPGISHLWSVCSPETPREKNKYQKPQRGQGISALPCISQGILVVPGPYFILRLAGRLSARCSPYHGTAVLGSAGTHPQARGTL